MFKRGDKIVMIGKPSYIYTFLNYFDKYNLTIDRIGKIYPREWFVKQDVYYTKLGRLLYDT